MILILMQSRSGSSLVASIFAAHGYKTRHDRSVNSFGYVNWEHVPAKRWAYSRKQRMNYRNGHFVRYIPGIFSGLRAAFEHHGLDFEESRARACVDPAKWHRR